MPAGVSGSLVSDYFLAELLEREFPGELGETGRAAARTACRRWRRESASLMGPVSSARAIFDAAAVPLARTLGFTPSSPRDCPGSQVVLAALGAAGSSLPLILATAWGEDLSSAWRRAARETLAAGTAWCLCTNGRQLRLADTTHACAERYVEFDLDVACEDQESFGVLWALLRREAFRPPAGARADVLPLIDRIVLASAARTVGVCRSLREGVLDAVGELMDALLPRPARRTGDIPPANLPALHEQALTMVYRALFLLFAESRGLVPTWHPTYRRSYSMEAARALAESSGPARGLWETLQAMWRLAHAGCRAGTLRVTPFNGRLFAPSLTPAGESGRPGDECARRVVLSLTTAPGAKGAGRARIVYRDLGVEQLGSVYEAVLDYEAVITPDATKPDPVGTATSKRAWRAEATKRDPVGTASSKRACRAEATKRDPVGTASSRRRVRLVPGSGLRKLTGTFYTPSSITSFIVRRALSPLVDGATPERILALRVLDPAMGSGAFLVAACRYLAAAYEEALLAGGGCHPSDIGDAERRSFRRVVAQQCLYGVDLNPTAVQLARLSLWLATLAPDRPLTFLDHRLLTGDSLVGASLDDLARCPFPGATRHGRKAPEDTLPLFPDEEAGAAVRAVLPARLRLAGPDDSLTAVREKERLLASVAGTASPLARWKRLADAWCALGFGLDSGERPPASLFLALADALAGRHAALSPSAADSWLSAVAATAKDRHFFHYTLEFPEVFFEASGRPRADAGFDAVLGNPPWDMIRNDDPRAAGASTVLGGGPSDAARLVRFARGSGIYRSLSPGHPNRFQLFVERAIRLARPGGRVGLVTPGGLLSDSGSVPLRRLLFDRCAIDALVAFDNTRRVFPIHRSVRFVVFTATVGASAAGLPCRIGERDPSVLDGVPDAGGAEHFQIVLHRSLLERVSGDDLAVPDLRDPGDLDLLEKLTASAPPLGGPAGWNVRFGRELNATDDKALFWSGPAGMPVVEGKHLHPFRLALPSTCLRVRPDLAAKLGARAAWFARPRLAYRDVACATNRLTSIAAIVPAGHVTVHTVFCLKTPLEEEEQWFLCGMLNSLVVNFLVRLRVATHVTVAIVSGLPVPRPAARSRPLRAIASLARGLAGSDAPDSDPRYAELQARAARLYGLELDDLRHVLGRFPLIPEPIKAGVLAAWGGGGGLGAGSSMG